MADKLAYTVSEAAEAVGVHRATIYRLVKAGELRLVKFAGRSVILLGEPFVQRQSVAALGFAARQAGVSPKPNPQSGPSDLPAADGEA